MAWDPDFIDFIDSYCDRWCERCPLTHRCATFDYERDAKRRNDAWRNHPMIVTAQTYSMDASAWLRMFGSATRANIERARAELTDSLEGAAVRLEIEDALDALAVVEWDGALIGAKVQRALAMGDDEVDDDEGDPIQTDRNGSAKLVLLLTERSEAGWRLVAQWAPESEVALRMASTLAALRGEVERSFPNARRFRRPGFDDPSR